MDKATLRQQYLNRRLQLSPSGYWIMTDEILEQVKLINWYNYQVLHIFLPIRSRNEVDTFSILNYFKAQHPELEIVVPRTDFKNQTITNIVYDHEYTILARNKQDIPEPIHGMVLPAQKIDVCLIPLLAFDKLGNRVGYGKGFYDRLLTQCRPDVKKIGLSFFDPVDKISDVNEFDIPLDMCITPGKTLLFNR